VRYYLKAFSTLAIAIVGSYGTSYALGGGSWRLLGALGVLLALVVEVLAELYKANSRD